MSEHETSKPKCPKCNGSEVTRVPVPFIAKTSKKS